MKRFTLFLACSFIFLSAIHSQDSLLINNTLTKPRKPIDFRNEIGINGTYFLKQIINLSDTSIAVSPYLLTYKMMFNNFGIRTGIGASYKKEKSTEEDFEDSSTDINSSYNFRFGLEYQNQFHKRWTASAGLDFIYNNKTTKFTADSGFDVFTEKTTTKGSGGGPVLGLYFNFNKHLSIYTEAAFYFIQEEEEQSREFTNFPQFDNTKDTIEISELETLLPTTLYVVFRF